MSPSVKSCICIRGLWLEVAGRDGDAQGTGERKQCHITVDGALPLIAGGSRELNLASLQPLLHH
jgi:hypothetical protein